MTDDEFWKQQTLAVRLLAVHQTARALEIALELVAARPDSSVAHELLTRALSHHGDKKSALQSAKKLVELAPEDANGWHWIAILERRPKRKREAIERALGFAPHNAALHAHRATILRIQIPFSLRNLWPEIEKSARLALQLNPRHIGAHHHLVARYLQAARFEEARETLQEALRIEPENSISQRLLAHCLKLRGEHGGEERALRESLRLDPTDKEAQNALEIAAINAKNSDLLETIYAKMFGAWPRFLPLPFSVALFYGAIYLSGSSNNWMLAPAILLGMIALFAASFALTPFYALIPAAWLPPGLQRFGKPAKPTKNQ